LIIQVQTAVDVIGSLEKHVERQQSQNENREATVSAAAAASASVKEQDNAEDLNVEESAAAGGEDFVQAVKQETAPTLAVKAETKEEEESASSVPRGASAAENEESLGENRDPDTSLSSVREEDNEEAALNNPSDALQDTQVDNIVSCLYYTLTTLNLE